jgi:multidrug efflux pump subunit AcrA (membrane-fusion protein)
VRSEIVTGGSSAESATYTAEIRSRYETDLSFQVAGKLVSRAVDVGATVKKGQVLAQLDQTDQQLGVDGARGAVPAAQSDLDRSRSEEARFRDLLERGPHYPRAVPGATDRGAIGRGQAFAGDR